MIQVDLDKERKLPLSDKQYNACFYGNPGGAKFRAKCRWGQMQEDLHPGQRILIL